LRAHIGIMRGETDSQGKVFAYVSLEERVPADHPLRAIKEIADEALVRLEPKISERYSRMGRPSIPPEVLLKSQVLMALYSVRSERLYCERLQYDLLFRWFLDLSIDSESFDATTFTKNRERILKEDFVEEFFRTVVEQAREKRFLSDEHFTVDGTMIEANASMKSFKAKGGPKGGSSGGKNGEVDFRGEKRSNQTHESTTDPDARLYRKGKGKPSQLCYLGHVLMENRNGLCVDATVTRASGKAEPEAAIVMVKRSTDPMARRVTLGADKGYDVGEFHVELVEEGVVAHIAAKEGITPLIGRRTLGSGGYRLSQRRRKRVEEIFGWMKTIAGLAKTRFRGLARVSAQVLFGAVAYDLLRMANLGGT
jgi:transposase